MMETNSPGFELARIKDNCLCYLGSLPKSLEHGDDKATAELVLNLGKLLLWISGDLDGKNAPRIVQPPCERAESVFALGEQFRLLGLRMLTVADRKTNHMEIHRRIAEIERTLTKIQKQGGAK